MLCMLAAPEARQILAAEAEVAQAGRLVWERGAVTERLLPAGAGLAAEVAQTAALLVATRRGAMVGPEVMVPTVRATVPQTVALASMEAAAEEAASMAVKVVLAESVLFGPKLQITQRLAQAAEAEAEEQASNLPEVLEEEAPIMVAVEVLEDRKSVV